MSKFAKGYYSKIAKANTYSIHKANQTVSMPKRQNSELYVSNVYMDGETVYDRPEGTRHQDRITSASMRRHDVDTQELVTNFL